MRQKRLGGSPKVGAYVWKLGVVCAMPPARLTSGGLLGHGEALRYLSQVRLRRAQNIVQLCVGIGPGVPKVKEQSWTAKGNRTIETSGFPASWMARRALRRPCSIGHDSPSYLSWPLPSSLDSRPCRKPSSISGSFPPPHAFSVRGLSRGGNPLQLDCSRCGGSCRS